MVTQIGTLFSYNYDHIILQAYTLIAVFKMHKAQKFLKEITILNSITALSFLVYLPFDGYRRRGGDFFGG
jgi:hypothetical protein